MRRGVNRAAVVVVAFALLPAASGVAQEPQASLPDIEDEVMCPVCGTLLQLASESPQAERERALIRQLIAQGKTKDEIKDELVAEYGKDVLAVPDSDGFDLVAWVVPGLVVVAGGLAIFLGLRRWRATSEAAEAPSDLTDPLAVQDQERLDAELSKFDG